MVTPVFNREPFNIGCVHKNAKSAFEKLIAATRAFEFAVPRFSSECRFEPYEGFRHPMRQLYLVEETEATKSRPWHSAHQYGLAVDFAVRIYKDDVPTGWSWPNSAPWDELRVMAQAFGLDVPVEWDRGHVVHPLWNQFQKVMK